MNTTSTEQVFLGISPETQKPMYLASTVENTAVSWEAARKNVEFRVPTEKEFRSIFDFCSQNGVKLPSLGGVWTSSYVGRGFSRTFNLLTGVAETQEKEKTSQKGLLYFWIN